MEGFRRAPLDGRSSPPQPSGVVIAADRFDSVVFDMDGVVTDTATVHAAAWKEMFDEFLVAEASRGGGAQPPFSESDYLDYVDGKQRDDGVSSFLSAAAAA